MIKNNKFMFLGLIGSFVFAIAFIIVAPAFAQIATYSQINGTTTLKVGVSGGDVSTLQKFLASNKDIYASGLVTGYFGSMTKSAVKNFQYAYDLSIDGVAGAITKNKVNSLISDGRGMDIYSPAINNLSVVTLGKNVTFTFTSNEAVKATVFYDTNRISWSDPVVSYGTPGISGTGVADNNFNSNKQITLNNLSANTTYNYTVLATDASGNFSVVWPNRFTTGQ